MKPKLNFKIEGVKGLDFVKDGKFLRGSVS
jgi:hypothetical protein